MANSTKIPPGIAQRLRQIEDENEDDVEYQVPVSWSVQHTTFNPSSMTSGSLNASSSASNAFTPSASSHDSVFAPALGPRQKREQPALGHYEGRFSFSTAIPDAPEHPSWTVKELHSSKSQREHITLSDSISTEFTPDPSHSERSTIEPKHIGALEATFGTESLSGEKDGPGSSRPLDPRLENPELNIPDNIRNNFLPINRLHEASSRQSKSGPVTIQLGGETLVYNPKSRDVRLDNLDRNQRYVGQDLGAISKRLKRQHREDIVERDRQMLQATAEWRAWSAMSDAERAALCERLKKPVFICGADKDDQYEEDELPEIYNREVCVDRVMNWEDKPPPKGPKSGSNRGPLSSRGPSSEASSVDAGFQLPEQSPEVDEFAQGEDFISLSGPVDRSVEETRTLLQNALNFKNSSYATTSKSGSSPGSSPRSSPFWGISRLPSHLRGKQTDASGYAFTSASTIGTASSSGLLLFDPFSIDIRPELQKPTDYGTPLLGDPNPREAMLFERATDLSLRNGRVVVVRLHDPVKFTPGAIVQRVFGGIVQEMQLFPAQRLAIIIFLHCTEARSFIRHVKSVSHYGNAHEIRILQIDADWYKGNEKDSIIPVQPNILNHHISRQATRALRFHRIPLSKDRREMSAELGIRLKKMLITVVLCTPQQRYKQLAYGRQAVVEFASIKDAIEARQAINSGFIKGYENCEPEFTNDSTIDPIEHKPYCHCCGCRDYRAARGI